MRELILKGAIIFAMLVVASFLMVENFQTQFGTTDFFVRHGIFFLIFITFFPRLTLVVSSVPFGGFLWWLGFFFCPRILVAILATVTYFQVNPFLVVVSWLVAISGEAAEKYGIGRSKFSFYSNRRTHGPLRSHMADGPHGPSNARKTVESDGDTIEAEYREL